jgi:protein O-mannosyl-transferase
MNPKHGGTIRTLLVCAGLSIATLAVYFQVAGFSFVNYDDPLYITENPLAQRGITAEGIRWAFTTGIPGYWHPLTLLSHMLDCQLFGVNAGAHHLVSVMFHVINTLLLFAVLREMTSAFWQSAFVAALFALHPLHVESVAWISERKDVLSTFFLLLTIGAYVRWVKKRSCADHVWMLVFFALGSMAKPMLVTMPVVLLVLDYWPLNRIRHDAPGWRKWLPLVTEKIPLFLLAIGVSALAYLLQQSSAALLEKMSVAARIENATLSYARYLAKTIWPQDLAIPYLLPRQMPTLWILAAAGLLFVLTELAIRQARKRPYLLAGWLWYAVTMLPVIGLIQIGMQAMADRYTYVPLIGIFVAVTWSAHDLAQRGRPQKYLVALMCVVVLMLCAGLSFKQIHYWKNTDTLFAHSVEATKDNYIAHFFWADDLLKRGKLEDAAAHYRVALKILPEFPEAHVGVAASLARLNKRDEAILHLQEALRIRPGFAEAQKSLDALTETSSP